MMFFDKVLEEPKQDKGKHDNSEFTVFTIFYFYFYLNKFQGGFLQIQIWIFIKNICSLCPSVKDETGVNILHTYLFTYLFFPTWFHWALVKYWYLQFIDEMQGYTDSKVNNINPNDFKGTERHMAECDTKPNDTKPNDINPNATFS